MEEEDRARQREAELADSLAEHRRGVGPSDRTEEVLRQLRVAWREVQQFMNDVDDAAMRSVVAGNFLTIVQAVESAEERSFFMG